jgi:hypothetical protein
VSGEWFFLFFLIKKETKKSSLGIMIACLLFFIGNHQYAFAISHRSNWFSNAKRKELGFQPQTAFLFTHPSNI